MLINVDVVRCNRLQLPDKISELGVGELNFIYLIK